MTKNDLVNAVAAHGLSKRQSASVVESVFDIIFRCFEKSEDVKIVGFGHFRIRRKASRRGRNPQTGDSIEITARKVLTFKPSKGLKQRINAGASVSAVMTDAAEKLYYRIGEVEQITEVPAYVLRYWESEFKLLRPKKNPAGQRLYRPRDLELVQRIKSLLYGERLTLEGAKKRLLAESRKTGAAGPRAPRGVLRRSAQADPRSPDRAAGSPDVLKRRRLSGTLHACNLGA